MGDSDHIEENTTPTTVDGGDGDGTSGNSKSRIKKW